MEVTKASEARRQTKAESEDTQVCGSGTAILSGRQRVVAGGHAINAGSSISYKGMCCSTRQGLLTGRTICCLSCACITAPGAPAHHR